MKRDAALAADSCEPFLPYAHHCIEADDVAAVVAVLQSPALTSGPVLERFEQALARVVGASGAVAVANGTAALHAACAAAGLGPGDEAIVPAITFLATANCARYVGAEPVFADVDPDTGLVTADTVAACVGPRTRAILPVHLAGLPADVAALRAIAACAGARIIEDAAHALGARAGAERVGGCAHADAAVFSFHPAKHVTTGEGGAVTSNDAALLERVRDFRNHGMLRDPRRLASPAPGPWYYEQQELGHNFRLSELHAALGVSQLAKLDRFVARRRALAARYDAALAALPQVVPSVPAARRAECAHHLYPVRIDFAALGIRRADVMERLRERGIGTQVHYIPLPMQPYFRARGARIEDCPGAQRYYERTLSLPLFPAMRDTDVDRVVAALAAVLPTR